jgi:hypothetical protein
MTLVPSDCHAGIGSGSRSAVGAIRGCIVPHAHPMAGRDRRVAPRPRQRRTHRGGDNLIKRIKRIGFGFRRFAHYRIRVLLYAGRPNWDLLNSVAPR